MNSVSHWIYFSWLSVCPLRLVFKTEQLFCGCNYQKSVWHNFTLVTEHIPGMELLGGFFYAFLLNFSIGFTFPFYTQRLVEINVKLSNPPSVCQGASGRLCEGQLAAHTLCGISAPCQWVTVGPSAVFLVPWKFALWGCCSCWKTLQDCVCPCVGDSQGWTAELKLLCKIAQQSSFGWTPRWRAGVCVGDGEVGTVSSCSWNSLWGFCSALTGEYQAKVAAWGLSDCSHPCTAMPGCSLHSWRHGCCRGLWCSPEPLHPQAVFWGQTCSAQQGHRGWQQLK